MADLLDENCKEIFLCGGKFQIPYSVGNVIYRGIGAVSLFINATGEMIKEAAEKGLTSSSFPFYPSVII